MTGGLAWWLTAALLCAVGILAKYTMVLLPVAVVGYLLVHRRHEFRRAGIWVLLAGTLLGWAANPLLERNAHWVTFRHVWGQVGTGKGSGLRWFGPLTFLGGQVAMMFGLWLVAFLAAAWRFRPSRERDPAIRLLWWCSVPVWFVFPLASLLKSGQPNWPAPAYAAGFILAVAWLRDGLNGPHRRHFVRCLGVNAALGLVIVAVVHFPAPIQPLLARIAGPPTERDPAPIRKVDITARLLGLEDTGGRGRSASRPPASRNGERASSCRNLLDHTGPPGFLLCRASGRVRDRHSKWLRPAQPVRLLEAESGGRCASIPRPGVRDCRRYRAGTARGVPACRAANSRGTPGKWHPDGSLGGLGLSGFSRIWGFHGAGTGLLTMTRTEAVFIEDGVSWAAR